MYMQTKLIKQTSSLVITTNRKECFNFRFTIHHETV